MRKKIDEKFLKYWGLSGAKACKSCRSRQELKAFPRDIYLQKSASIPPRTGISKFGSDSIHFFNSLINIDTTRAYSLICGARGCCFRPVIVNGLKLSAAQCEGPAYQPYEWSYQPSANGSSRHREKTPENKLSYNQIPLVAFLSTEELLYDRIFLQQMECADSVGIIVNASKKQRTPSMLHEFLPLSQIANVRCSVNYVRYRPVARHKIIPLHYNDNSYRDIFS